MTASSPTFTHLRLHTEFSVVDGTIRIDEVVASAASDGQGALAISDLSNLFGAVKFYKAARSKGVKPLIGADVWVQTPGHGAAGSGGAATRLLLLVQNQRGYLNLSELLTRAWTLGVVRDQPVISLAWLAELNEGLIALSGAQRGAVGQALVQGDEVRAADCALQLAGIFVHRFYLELQRAEQPDDVQHVSACVQLAARLKLPVVATHPVQFLGFDELRGARGAGVHCRGRDFGQRAASAQIHPRAVFQNRSADGSAVCRCAKCPGQHGGNCQALQPRAGFGQADAARVSDARNWRCAHGR
jgi:DNA polymerase III alpha subunit